MSTCLHNILLRLYQYFNILSGFSYIFIDLIKHQLRVYKYLKIYVYIVNLLYIVLVIIFFIRYLLNTDITYEGDESIAQNIYITYNITCILILKNLFILRFKEDKLFEQLYKIFKEYCNQLIFNTSLDKTTEILQIFNILLIFFNGIFTIQKIILIYKDEDIIDVIEGCIIDLFTIIEQCIMFHHSFLLSYITNGFLLYKNHLINERNVKNFYTLFNKIILLMKEVNNINGPIIFGVIISQLIKISIHILMISQLIQNIPIGLLNFAEFLEIFIVLLSHFNILLYFFICDRQYKIIKETENNLLEYIAKHRNQDVIYVMHKHILLNKY